MQGYKRWTAGSVAFFVKAPADPAAAQRYRQRPDWLAGIKACEAQHRQPCLRARSNSSVHLRGDSFASVGCSEGGQQQRKGEAAAVPMLCDDLSPSASSSDDGSAGSDARWQSLQREPEATEGDAGAAMSLPSEAEAVPIVFLHGVGLGMVRAIQ